MLNATHSWMLITGMSVLTGCMVGCQKREEHAAQPGMEQEEHQEAPAVPGEHAAPTHDTTATTAGTEHQGMGTSPSGTATGATHETGAGHEAAATPPTGQLVKPERHAYQQQIHDQIKVIENEITQLKDKMTHDPALHKQHQAHVSALETKLHAAKEKLSELEKAADAAWEASKTKMQQSVDELKKSVEELHHKKG